MELYANDPDHWVGKSVDGFHSIVVTSEDNAYFEQNMVKEVKEKKDKMGIIYGTMCPTMAKKSKVSLLLQNHASNGNASTSLSTSLSPFQSASDQFNPPVDIIIIIFFNVKKRRIINTSCKIITGRIHKRYRS